MLLDICIFLKKNLEQYYMKSQILMLQSIATNKLRPHKDEQSIMLDLVHIQHYLKFEFSSLKLFKKYI